MTAIGLTTTLVLLAAGAEEGSAPAILESADVVEHLGAQIPPELEFRDMAGRPVRIADLLDDGRPVLLVTAYYRCPMLCGLVLRTVSSAVQGIPWKAGERFNMVTISFDPREGPEEAAERHRTVLAAAPGIPPQAWSFWTGTRANIDTLLDTLGVKMQRDPRTGQFAHPAVFFVLTPDGRISRYIYGVDARPFDLKLALLEASRGETRTTVERVLLRCFMYDPATRRYGLFITQYFRAGAAFILIVLLAGLAALYRRDFGLGRGEAQS